MRTTTTTGLIADGVLDGELAALLWLLVDGGLPLTVVGSADAESRQELAAAVLAIDPESRWVVLDADAEPPTTERLAALLLGGVGVGINFTAADLQETLERLSSPPVNLPEDAQRRLGVIIVLDNTATGPRCSAVHYLRPAERDAQGHVQRRPPAVLAAWDENTDSYEHYAWGITPELADRVDRAQADFEDRQRERSLFLHALAAESSSVDLDSAVAGYLAQEPDRVPAPKHEQAAPSPFKQGLTDPHEH